jgi:hypothetical protein
LLEALILGEDGAMSAPAETAKRSATVPRLVFETRQQTGQRAGAVALVADLASTGNA